MIQEQIILYTQEFLKDKSSAERLAANAAHMRSVTVTNTCTK